MTAPIANRTITHDLPRGECSSPAICAVADFSPLSLELVSVPKPWRRSFWKSNSSSILVLTPRSLRSELCRLRKSSSCRESRRLVGGADRSGGVSVDSQPLERSCAPALPLPPNVYARTQR